MERTLDAASIVEPIARAVADVAAQSVSAVLARLQGEGAFGAGLFLPPRADRYVRKLIHRDPAGRFVVVAMTWGTGHGSPLHDHAGTWGAEVVVNGRMNETPFSLIERAGDGRYRFERGASRVCVAGDVSVLEPPQEYHAFGNGGTSVAHTLHVYGGELGGSRCFRSDDTNWWNPYSVELSYDA